VSFARLKLKEVVNLVTKGTTPTSIDLAFATSGVPFIRVQNLRNGRVNLNVDPLYVSPETHRALGRSMILPGDVLISIAGTIGRIAVVDRCAPEMNCNQAVAIIRPGARLDSLFLKYWLQSVSAQKQMLDGQVTGTITNLSLTAKERTACGLFASRTSKSLGLRPDTSW